MNPTDNTSEKEDLYVQCTFCGSVCKISEEMEHEEGCPDEGFN